MNHDEHDDLWNLLGKARVPRVSPFFSRNVLRAIREENAGRRGGWLRVLRWHWRGISIATAVLAVCAGGSVHLNRRQVADARALDEVAHEVASSPDFSVIDNLDTLLASDDNDVWLDPSLH